MQVLITRSNHAFIREVLLFGFIFLVFFSSAVGIYNSMDAPQYLTTESIIKYQKINIDSFREEPLYITDPDVFYLNNKTYNVRGYVVSILAIPLHILAKVIQSLYNLDWFDNKIQSINLYTYVLAITSLFTIFTIIGLYFFWKTTKALTNEFSATITTLLLAFGTYIWKYSTSYTRHGISVGILGISFYLLHLAYTKVKYKYIFIFYIILAISYGIDSILFMSLLPVGIFSTLFYVKEKKMITMKNISLLIIPLGILTLILYINKYNYNSYLSIQTLQQPIVKNSLGDKSKTAWFSTPIFPTIYCVLFCSGKIPEQSFRNFNNFPDDVKIFASLAYAQKSNFYGLFVVTPIFFLTFFLLFYTLTRYHRIVIGFILLTASLGILANTKVLVFWGGNQYDIRYITPYALLLGFPVALFIYKVNNEKNKIIKFCLNVILVTLGLFSVYMSWLGVLAMFLPALTGENRLLLEPETGWLTLLQLDPSIIFRLTFMNFSNISVGIMLLGYFVIITKMLRKINRLFTIKSGRKSKKSQITHKKRYF